MISSYHLLQNVEGKYEPCYSLTSRSTLKSDAGLKRQTSSFFALVPLKEITLDREKIVEIKQDLEKLIIS